MMTKSEMKSPTTGVDSGALGLSNLGGGDNRQSTTTQADCTTANNKAVGCVGAGMSDVNTQSTMSVTVFNSLHAQTGVLRTPTWDGFCETIKTVKEYNTKESQQLLKLGVYENNSRAANSKLISISGIEIDYDAGQVSMDEAAKRLKDAGIKALLCSTYTSTSNLPKWRAFIPLDGEVAAKHRPAWVAACDSTLGGIAAPESYTPKQIFFFGRGSNGYRVVDCQGEYINTLPAMKQAADDYSANEQDTPQTATTHTQHHTRYTSSNSGDEDVREALMCIPAGIERTQWIRVIAALHSSGLYELALEWSSQWSKFNKAKFDKEWNSFNSGTVITIATMFAIAKEYGYKNQRKEKQTDSNYSTNQSHYPQSAKQEPHRQQDVKQERHQSSTDGDHIKLVSGSSITPRRLEWVWDNYLPKGKLALVVGAPKTGKTMVSLSLAAIITSGGKFPDGTQAKLGKVLFWSGEDDLEDTIVPRFKAMGGNLDNIMFIDNTTLEGKVRPFSPSDDMPTLLDTLERLGEDERPTLLIIDPIVAVTKEMNNALEVRRGLEPVVQMAQKFKMGVLGITHFRKSKGESGLGEQIIGSSAFLQVARTVFYAIKPPEDDGRRVFFRGDTNIAGADEGFLYDVETVDAEFPEHDMIVETAGVCWGEKVSGDELQEMINPDNKSDSAPAKIQAEDFLQKFLADGGRFQEDVKAAAKQAGIAMRTLDRAKSVKHGLGIKSEKEKGVKNGRWTWSLPSDNSKPEECQADPVGNVGDLGGLGNLQKTGGDTEEDIF